MEKKQWYKILGKEINEGGITAKDLAENRLNEDKVDRVAGVVSSYLLRIADDIASLTNVLDQNDTDEMKERLIAALPSREPKSSDFADAFFALDVMAAGKVSKFYRELAKNLKK
jgi:hypothetical protein